MSKNTQKPVAWIEACDLDEAVTSGSAAAVIHGTQPDYEYVPLYAAPLVPRDVLMAFGEEVLNACFDCVTSSRSVNEANGKIGRINLSAMADLHTNLECKK